MDPCNVEFAREMVAALGEDRFYHAVMRPTIRGAARTTVKREARLFFLALGGSERGWEEKCQELKLEYGSGMAHDEMDPDEAREALCRTSYLLSRHHKEYALKGPQMPPSIHARMVLDEQNQWTKKYAQWLSEQD
jgi:hypothetical protein